MSKWNKQVGSRQDELRERMRRLGLKARMDPRSLSLKDLDEICSLTAALGPGAPLLKPLIPPVFQEPFEPLVPDASDIDTQAFLRLAHAAENIAFQLSEIVRLAKEGVVQERWKAVRVGFEADRLSAKTPATHRRPRERLRNPHP